VSVIDKSNVLSARPSFIPNTSWMFASVLPFHFYGSNPDSVDLLGGSHPSSTARACSSLEANVPGHFYFNARPVTDFLQESSNFKVWS
jgi:hypothetical protein